MSNSPTLTLEGIDPRDLVRAMLTALPPESLATAIAASLTPEERQEAYTAILRESMLITPEQGGELVHWTDSGFLRVATRENCPSVKLGHKQPPLYRLRDVTAMLQKLRVWPKGRPVAEAA